MLAKRIALVLISLSIGWVLTNVAIMLMQTTVEAYWTAQGVPYYPLTIFFIGCGFGIWLDKFMGTEILAE